jgi:hypothetical protein
VIIEGMKAAKAKGALVSFDLNYREKLWKIYEKQNPQEKAQEVMSEIVSLCDIIVGNEEDLQMGLGLKGPDVEGSKAKDKLDPSAFFGMIDSTVKKFPNIKIIATTLREVHTTNRHTWSAVCWINGQTYIAPQCELDVYDRVGESTVAQVAASSCHRVSSLMLSSIVQEEETASHQVRPLNGLLPILLSDELASAVAKVYCSVFSQDFSTVCSRGGLLRSASTWAGRTVRGSFHPVGFARDASARS